MKKHDIDAITQIEEIRDTILTSHSTLSDHDIINQFGLLLTTYNTIRRQSASDSVTGSNKNNEDHQHRLVELGHTLWTDAKLFSILQGTHLTAESTATKRLANRIKRRFINHGFKPDAKSSITFDTIDQARVLPILQFPDAKLRTQAQPVTRIDEKLQQLIDDMIETMYAADGVGLAATQIDQPVRLFVMDISDDQSNPYVFINPVLTITGNTTRAFVQGCLSVEGAYDSVTRPAKVRIDALDRNGTAFSMEDDGIMAVVFQHEIDHLNGKLFIDHLPAEKQPLKTPH